MCVCVKCACECSTVGLDLLELELQAVVNHLTWVLGTEPDLLEEQEVLGDCSGPLTISQ